MGQCPQWGKKGKEGRRALEGTQHTRPRLAHTPPSPSSPEFPMAQWPQTHHSQGFWARGGPNPIRSKDFGQVKAPNPSPTQVLLFCRFPEEGAVWFCLENPYTDSAGAGCRACRGTSRDSGGTETASPPPSAIQVVCNGISSAAVTCFCSKHRF